ncbi:MAG: Fe-S cluster assembly protein SufD [Steroidobacteraceae bacterium]
MKSDPRQLALNTLAEQLGQLSPGLPGGSAWSARRHQALQRLLAEGLPDKRNENWRYLDWAELDRRSLTAPAGLHGGLAHPPGTPGLEILPLGEALEREGERLAALLPLPGSESDAGFDLLAEASTGTGWWVRVAAGVEVGEPLQILHQRKPDASSHLRVIIELGAGARLHLIERFAGGDGEVLSVQATSLFLADGSALQHTRLFECSGESALVDQLEASVERDARYRQALFMLGGRVLRSSQRLRLRGRAAEAELDGLFVVDGQRQADLYTVIDHEGPQTRSRERVHGVASGRGRAAFNGRILVGPAAAGSDSSQTSRNLLLSPTAEINARPQLEILTDEVKCSHGATTGSLDPDQLFYLLSRGIDPETARGILTYAFCEDVVGVVTDPAVRRRIEELVAGQLPDRDLIQELL